MTEKKTKLRLTKLMNNEVKLKDHSSQLNNTLFELKQVLETRIRI